MVWTLSRFLKAKSFSFFNCRRTCSVNGVLVLVAEMYIKQQNPGDVTVSLCLNVSLD